MKRIFVQIASYRDQQLIPTLIDLIDKCTDPARLHIAICWQHGNDETITNFTADEDFTLANDANDKSNQTCQGFSVISLERRGSKLSLIDVNCRESKGACWARNLLQGLWSDEEYTLQIDSHMRFIEAWDAVLVYMLENLRNKCNKPILTGYPPSFFVNTDPWGREFKPCYLSVECVTEFGVVRFKPHSIEGWEALTNPIPTAYYSAGFAFTLGQFVGDVPHDPQLFFHGEEVNIAARAFTHGYDLFHPHRVVCWHQYIRKGSPKFWDDHPEWPQLERTSVQRYRALFGIDNVVIQADEWPRYGFGNQRTLEDYENYSGISFKDSKIHPCAISTFPMPVAVPRVKGFNWRDYAFACCSVRVQIKRTDLLNELADYTYFQFDILDKNGATIYLGSLDPNTIKEGLSSGDAISLTESVFYRTLPTRFRLTPYSQSTGWMNCIERELEIV